MEAFHDPTHARMELLIKSLVQLSFTWRIMRHAFCLSLELKIHIKIDDHRNQPHSSSELVSHSNKYR